MVEHAPKWKHPSGSTQIEANQQTSKRPPSLFVCVCQTPSHRLTSYLVSSRLAADTDAYDAGRADTRLPRLPRPSGAHKLPTATD
jgi:hypothetical protein